jgi:hypothetical protein
MLKLTDIRIERVATMPGARSLVMEWGDLKFTGYFDDMGGFITAVGEAARFYAVRNGLLRSKDARFTREVQAGRMDGLVLPGDKRQ